MTTFFSWQHAIRKSQLEPTTKLVLYTIATYMAADGSGCFPSYGTIAEGAGLSRSTTIAHVGKAVSAGFLSKVGRRDDDGENTSNLYQAMMPGGGPAERPPSPADGLPLVRQPDPNIPSDLPTEPTPKAPKGAAPGFDEFWSAYPKKVKRVKALALWNKLKPDLAAVLEGIRRWKASDQWTKNNGQFVPHPTTWLNDEGWNDAVPGEKAPPSEAELQAFHERQADAKRRNEERNRRMVEERRRSLGLTS